MSITNEHGKIVVAIIAMTTLSVLFIQCSEPPRCRVRTETITILVLIIGTMLSVEIIDIFNRGGDR